jgi:hypothetical protein
MSAGSLLLHEKKATKTGEKNRTKTKKIRHLLLTNEKRCRKIQLTPGMPPAPFFGC